jgi:hypothetical protein
MQFMRNERKFLFHRSYNAQIPRASEQKLNRLRTWVSEVCLSEQGIRDLSF